MIIVCVFAVFVGTGIPIIKEIGLGGAFAIAVDATLIRLVLVPATMTLLGDRSWWFPAPLERALSRSAVGKQSRVEAEASTREMSLSMRS